MGRHARHPLAGPPKESLGRYAKPPKPTASPVQRPHFLPAIGEHLWVLMSWHLITPGQASALAHGATVAPKAGAALAQKVGCYLCHVDYEDGVSSPCTASLPPDTAPEPDEPVPLDTPTEHEVPVEPPTPPSEGPPVVELAWAMAELAPPRPIDS